MMRWEKRKIEREMKKKERGNICYIKYNKNEKTSKNMNENE